jgi:hypothetical protein
VPPHGVVLIDEARSGTDLQLYAEDQLKLPFVNKEAANTVIAVMPVEHGVLIIAAS